MEARDRTGDRNNCTIANEFRDDAGIMSLQATDEGHTLDGEQPAAIPDTCESRRIKSLMLLICS